jgi:amidohydrolase
VAVAGRVAADMPALVAQKAADRVAGGEMLLVFGSLRAGDAANVIPTTALLRGSARMPDPEVWAQAEEIVTEALDQLIGDSGAIIRLDYVRGIPAVVNAPDQTHAMAAATRRVLGDDAVIEAPRSFGGDTFAWYLDHVPGCLARLGVHDPAWGDRRLDLHSGAFDVDERSIDIGIRIFVDLLLDRLG